MVIDKIGNIGKILRPDQSQSPKKTHSSEKSGADTVNISAEALKAQEKAQAENSIRKTSDIRHERVQEVKNKLANGDYDNIDNEILEKVAEKIAQSFIR